MKKISIFVMMLLLFSAFITACGSSELIDDQNINNVQNKDNKKENKSKNNKKNNSFANNTNDKEVALYSIDMYIGSENVNNIYYARYPYHYFKVDSKLHKTQLVSFPNKLNKVISREDFNVFYDFIMKNSDKQTNNGNPLYSIALNYYDEEGESMNLYYFGYNDFSEELNVLVDKFNELCGEEVLAHPTKPLTLNADFIYNKFGVTAADYPREDVEAMLLTSRNSSLYNMLTKNYNLDSEMNNYYLNNEMEKIKYMFPTELQEAQSVSDKEYDEFINDFLEKLGDDWEIDEYSDQVDLRRITNTDTNERFYVGKAETLQKYKTYIDNNGPQIELDAGMEDMTYTTTFIYNNNNKYILVDFMYLSDNNNLVMVLETFYNMD